MLDGIQYKEFMRFFTISAGLGFQVIIFTSIPFLFYRPAIECYEKSQDSSDFNYFSCNEFEACNIIHKYQDNEIFEQNPLRSEYLLQDPLNSIEYLIKFIVKYDNINSISMEYNLFCDRKIIEVNILGFSLFCQVFASILALIIKIPPYFCQKLFLGINIISFFITLSFYWVDNLYLLGVVYCLWNFQFQYDQSVIYSQINQSFSQKIQEFAPTITNILWAVIAIIYVCGAFIIRDYRYNLGIFVSGMAAILVITNYYFYDKKLELEQKKQYDLQQQQNNEIARIENQNYMKQILKHFFLDYKIIINNKTMKQNSLTWTLCMTVITVCYLLCLVLLNTLLGNLYVNNLGHSVLELLGNSLSGYYVYKKVSMKKSIKRLFIYVGAAYTISLLMSLINDVESSEVSNFVIFQRIFPILIGKAIHEVAWTFLYTYINDLVAKEQQQFATAMGQFTSLVCGALVPYYKYLMEYIQVNSFIILPFICFLTAYCVQNYMHSYDYSQNEYLIQDQEINKSKKQAQPIELQYMEDLK